MVRCGALDGHPDPTPQSPILLVCPRCDRKQSDCPSCGGRGTFRVEQHPRQLVPPWVWRVCQLADMYLDHGVPPVGGGSLEQSNWFSEAAMFCIGDRDRILAERYGKA